MVNLTTPERNELALERGFLRRNGYTNEEIDGHIATRANTLHWQNQSEQDIAAWQAEGVVPEFGYDPAQSGRQLDFENNAERTAWALGVAEGSSDEINAWQADNIGVTQGVEDATTRLNDHWIKQEPGPGSEVVNALSYTFGSSSNYINALNRMQENPSVDEIQEFRDNIDAVLNNDIYDLDDVTRSMLEDSRSDFDTALAGAQDTRNAAADDGYLAASQEEYSEMEAEFDRVSSEGGGVIGRFNREALGLDHQTLGVHADATEEEITAFEVLASIPADERTAEQQAAYSVLAQSLLGTNTTTGTTSGFTRFDQGDQLAEGFEEFINDNSKQNILLGSAIVGTGVSFVNPVAGGAIIVGGTGGALSLDKVTGNDDLTWGEVATETGISGGSVLTGYGVSRIAGSGARLFTPTTRGGRVALGGGTFLAEEVASEGLINAGAAFVRGEDIDGQTFLDPVGLLYGLPFAAGDARGIIRGAPTSGTPANPTRRGWVDDSPLAPGGANTQRPPEWMGIDPNAPPPPTGPAGARRGADRYLVDPNASGPVELIDLSDNPGFDTLNPDVQDLATQSIDGLDPVDAWAIHEVVGSDGFSLLDPKTQREVLRYMGSDEGLIGAPGRHAMLGLIDSPTFDALTPQAQASYIDDVLGSQPGTPQTPGRSDGYTPQPWTAGEVFPVTQGFANGWGPAVGSTTDIGGHKVDVIGASQAGTLPDLAVVNNALASLPPADLARIKTVVLHPDPEPRGAAMTAGPDGTINVYPTTAHLPQDVFTDILAHETGHHVSFQEYGQNQYDPGLAADGATGQVYNSPNWYRWAEATEADGLRPSQYAKADLGEDFAETYRLYIARRGQPDFEEYRQLMPARFALLDQIVGAPA